MKEYYGTVLLLCGLWCDHHPVHPRSSSLLWRRRGSEVIFWFDEWSFAVDSIKPYVAPFVVSRWSRRDRVGFGPTSKSGSLPAIRFRDVVFFQVPGTGTALHAVQCQGHLRRAVCDRNVCSLNGQPQQHHSGPHEDVRCGSW